jgi:Fe-S-cluster containining protein
MEVLHSRFGCRKCGSCCIHGGQIKITPAEAQRIADYLDIDMGDMSLFPFTARLDDPDWLYLEVKDPCFFWDKVTRECMIHDVKPAMCNDYPWKLYQAHDCLLQDVVFCPVAYADIVCLLASEVEV